MTSPPSRAMRALPKGIGLSPSSTSPLVPYSAPASRKITQLSSRTAVSIMPLRIVGARGSHHLQAGEVPIEGLQGMSVLGGELDASAVGSPYHQRNLDLAAGEIAGPSRRSG